ncbi:caspase family protein [Variovorax terrae]|uniref:Caspase family protein n=1 Tax=Variovorax terrae TaxID=2923278 RepID=A0A9X1VV52_9BURK|nr:caspase family protein [Variovorax terrae]MCJ0763962.1 caspase family protein [Variovorax terrae]
MQTQHPLIRRALAFLMACLLGAAAHAADAEKRVALVIGNSTYKNSPLKNPTNDAKDMAARLRALGFEVIERSNLRTRQMGATLREFRSKLTPGAVALVFYAGHGVQIRGENYLPTVDAEIDSEEDVPSQSLSMKQVMDVLEDAKTRLNLVFLDACRNNPYARGFRSTGEGLARVSAPSGTLISYATRPGSVAADGSGKNGLYTGHLLKQMEQSNQPVEQVLKRVVTGVKNESAGRQEPWMEGSIEGDFCFGNCAAGTLMALAAPSAGEIEDQLWDSIKASRSPAVFEDYLAKYPRGRYMAQSRVRLASLKGDSSSEAAARDAEAAFWRAAEAGGTRAELQAYLAQYPQGQFVQTARTRIIAIEETDARKKKELDEADRAARASAAKVASVDPDMFISDKVRGEIARSRALFPQAHPTRTAKVVMAVGGKDLNMTVRHENGLCVVEYGNGLTVFYHAAGTLAAGGTKALHFLHARVVETEQVFNGSIATLSPGQSMVATIQSRGLPGETRVSVGETRASWPEYNFPYPGTQLRIVRDFETAGGYLKAEEIRLYSPEVGCALPVSEDITEIHGNKLFGQKLQGKAQTKAFTLADLASP